MADTRQRILDVAQELFTDVGYEGTSLRAIAERLGITKAALYYYFPSKEALLDALISPTFEFLRSVMPALLASTEPADWAEPMGKIVDWLIDHQPLFALVRRNQGVIGQLAHESDTFARHEDIHQALDALAGNAEIPLDVRVRLMCSIAVATSLVEIGDGFLAESPEEVRRILKAVLHAVLHADLPVALAAP